MISKKEVKKILRIMATVDGGCYYCVGKLYNYFIDDFPEYEKLAKKIFVELFDGLTIEQAMHK